MQEVTFRLFTPNDRDWLVDQHSELYAADEGFDDSFRVLVGTIADAFLHNHDPAKECGWIAQQGATRLGSIFCVRINDETAKLRMFLLRPEARGQGLGQRLLVHCMDFARAKGYRTMQLWTHETHHAATARYRRNGWTMEDAKAVHAFGQPNVEQIWSIVL